MRVAKPLGLTHHVAIIYKYFPSKVTGVRGIDDHEFFETTGSVTIILVSPRRSRRRLADVLGVADLCQAGEGKSLRQRDLFERTTIPRADQGNRPGNRKSGDRVGQSLVRV